MPGIPTLKIPRLERPAELTVKQLRHAVLQHYGLNVVSTNEFVSYVDRIYHVTVDTKYTVNTHIAEPSFHGYVVKILNKQQSKSKEYVEAVALLCLHMAKAGLMCPIPKPTIDGAYFTRHTFNAEEKHRGDSHAIWLFQYIPGVTLSKVEYEPDLLYNVGKYLGMVHEKLKLFTHSFYEHHDHHYALHHVSGLLPHVHRVKDETDTKLVIDVIQSFQSNVLQQLEHLEVGMTHGDPNHNNIIVDNIDGKYDIVGMIDMCHAVKTCYVFDVAMVIAYVMLDAKPSDVVDIGGHLLAGYSTERTLNPVERDVLKDCVSGRIAQSFVLRRLFSKLEIGNSNILTPPSKGWQVLGDFWNIPKGIIYDRWEEVIREHADH